MFHSPRPVEKYKVFKLLLSLHIISALRLKSNRAIYSFPSLVAECTSVYTARTLYKIQLIMMSGLLSQVGLTNPGN